MKRPSLSSLVLSVNFMFMAVPHLSIAAPQVCSDIFNDNRGFQFEKVEWNNDRSYIEALQQQETYGQVSTYFSKTWDTQVYYTRTAPPNHKGEVPLIDPESKAVYIFFHGSGTMKSSGRNYISNMNTLAKLGYSALSVDMPFHAEGPRADKFNNAFTFMEWARSIVLEAKKSGKPVYLVGHSFGPDVILEFAARYPKTIDGIVGLSPASFNKELSRWYDNYTTKMTFGGDVPENIGGGTWAAHISQQFLWSKQKLSDPTVVNPALRVRILSGNREEYVPAPLNETYQIIGNNTYDVSVPLRSLLKNSTVTVEPGIGHYLFDHVDANGHNVVIRELLAIDNVSASRQKEVMEEIKKENQTLNSSIQLAKRYSQDRIFQSWADLTYGSGKILHIARHGQDSLIQKVMTEFVEAQQQRESEIYKKVQDTKNSAPEFYAKYQTVLEGKKTAGSLFVPYLQQVLNKDARSQQP